MGDLFFVLAKSFWLLARPDSVLIALLALGLWVLWRERRPRLGRRLVGLSLTGFVISAIWPVQSLLLGPLERRFPIDPPVDAVAGIVVLGGGEDLAGTQRSGWPQVNQAGDRFLAALALAQRHPQARVVFAGGEARLRPQGRESRVAEAILVGGGLDPSRLTLESRSRNTAENAALSLQLVGETQGTWLLVTSASHMPRALGTFCAAGWTGLVPFPVDHRSAPLRMGWNPSGNLYELHAVMREWVGLAAYRMTGRSSALFPSGCQ